MRHGEKEEQNEVSWRKKLSERERKKNSERKREREEGWGENFMTDFVEDEPLKEQNSIHPIHHH